MLLTVNLSANVHGSLTIGIVDAHDDPEFRLPMRIGVNFGETGAPQLPRSAEIRFRGGWFGRRAARNEQQRKQR